MKAGVLLFFLALTFFCCNSVTSEENNNQEDSLQCKNPNQINPNGDSEMALLMREMTKFSEETGKNIRANKNLGSFPSTFEKLLGAKTTDTTLNRAVLNGFASDFLSKLKLLYDSENDIRDKSYNAMINSCITCHENFCNGPIKRIKKMFLPEQVN